MKVNQTGKYVSVLYRLIMKHMTEVLKKYGLTNIEYVYLMILMDGSKKTQEELTKQAFVDKSQTTRAVQSLAKGDLVIKECNPNDKRSYLVTLTQEGLELAPKIHQEIERMETKLNKGFDKQKQGTMVRELIQMIRNMKEEDSL